MTVVDEQVCDAKCSEGGRGCGAGAEIKWKSEISYSLYKCCYYEAVSKRPVAIILKCTTAAFVPFLPLLKCTLSLLQEEGLALITGWLTMAGV